MEIAMRDPKTPVGFTYHTGSECPVNPKSKVIVFGWNGVTYQPKKASDINWSWRGFSNDVYAYKVIK